MKYLRLVLMKMDDTVYTVEIKYLRDVWKWYEKYIVLLLTFIAIGINSIHLKNTWICLVDIWVICLWWWLTHTDVCLSILICIHVQPRFKCSKVYNYWRYMILYSLLLFSLLEWNNVGKWESVLYYFRDVKIYLQLVLKKDDTVYTDVGIK